MINGYLQVESRAVTALWGGRKVSDGNFVTHHAHRPCLFRSVIEWLHQIRPILLGPSCLSLLTEHTLVEHHDEWCRSHGNSVTLQEFVAYNDCENCFERKYNSVDDDMLLSSSNILPCDSFTVNKSINCSSYNFKADIRALHTVMWNNKNYSSLKNGWKCSLCFVIMSGRGKCM